MMKLILGILVVASWACGFYVYVTSLNIPSTPVQFLYLFPLVFVINLLCGRYLYKKAEKNQTEWALVGLLGNINAIFVYWIFNHLKERHKQSKSIFGRDL
jgi:hypothetical protein